MQSASVYLFSHFSRRKCAAEPNSGLASQYLMASKRGWVLEGNIIKHSTYLKPIQWPYCLSNLKRRSSCKGHCGLSGFGKNQFHSCLKGEYVNNIFWVVMADLSGSPSWRKVIQGTLCVSFNHELLRAPFPTQFLIKVPRLLWPSWITELLLWPHLGIIMRKFWPDLIEKYFKWGLNWSNLSSGKGRMMKPGSKVKIIWPYALMRILNITRDICMHFYSNAALFFHVRWYWV